MVDLTPQLQRAVQDAGFRSLTVDVTAHRATLLHQDGTEQLVFVKQARSARRSAREAAALHRIAQSAAGRVPVPELVAQVEVADLPISLLTYIAGEDLATVLPADADAPPLPPWYHGQRATSALSQSVLYTLMVALGRVVRALHGIRLPGFGLLLGNDPKGLPQRRRCAVSLLAANACGPSHHARAAHG